MASGLVFVPAKALAAHPSASASLALLDFVKANKSQLTFYDYQHLVKLGRPAGVILAIVDQYSEVKDQATNQLQPLPPVSEDAADDEELEPIEPTDPSDDEELEEVELPEEQGAQLMEDDSPDEWDNDWGDQWKAGYPDDHDDQIDAKNIPSFDPDLDPEKEWFSDDAVNAWVKADWDECRKGAKPRFYERFDGENIEGPESNEYNPSPLTCILILSPYSVTHVPQPLSSLHYIYNHSHCSFPSSELTPRPPPPHLPGSHPTYKIHRRRLPRNVPSLRIPYHKRTIQTVQRV